MKLANKLGTLAGIAAASLAVVGGVALAASKAAPSNTSLPSISGAARDGSTLTGSNGGWNHNPRSFSYGWQRCDSDGGSCQAIAGANSRHYTITTTDVGHRLRVVVTATNADGSGDATSRPTSVVSATGSAPANRSAPSLSGNEKEGETLTVNRGSWSGNPAPTFTYQWQRCNPTAGGGCVDIAGAQATTYKLAAADVAHTVKANVNATNPRGSTLAATPESGLVAPAVATGGGGGNAVPVTQVSLPQRLIIDNVKFSPTVLQSRSPVVARFHVSDTRGFSIQGALVFALGLPYGWTRNAPETPTDSTGWATVTLSPTAALPLRRGALVVFVRARKPSDNLLAGVSTRRLVQVSIR